MQSWPVQRCGMATNAHLPAVSCPFPSDDGPTLRERRDRRSSTWHPRGTNDVRSARGILSIYSHLCTCRTDSNGPGVRRAVRGFN